MKKINLLCAMTVLLSTSAQAWAYGSSSSSKSCAKPVFSEFNPADKSVVNKQAAFSFFVSQISNPKSIVVTVKQQELSIQATPKKGGFQISGKLPTDIGSGMARINVAAESAGKCKANDGWLVNISE